MRVPGQGRAEGGPFTGPVGTAASQIFNVAQSFVFESAFKFSNIQCFMAKVENGEKMNESLMLLAFTSVLFWKHCRLSGKPITYHI